MVTQTQPYRRVCSRTSRWMFSRTCRWLLQGLVDGGIAVALSLSLGLVLGRRVGVDTLGVVVRLEDVLLGVGLMLSPGVSSNLLPKSTSSRRTTTPSVSTPTR